MDRAVTIGTFDGVHRGHKLVLDLLKSEAERRDMQPMAITFDRHPLDLISPEKAPGNLLSVRRKEQLIALEGVKPLILTFNEQLRKMTAYEWLSQIHRKYDVRMLVMGYDNTFGSDGIYLSISDLKTMGEAVGIEMIEAPEIAGVSSSRIRRAVKAGDIVSAAAMLGYNPELEGRVVAGFHVGTDLGFPTANLQPIHGSVIPLGGVYAARAFKGNSSEWKPAMVNIGNRPTFAGTGVESDHTTIEAHIIGEDSDLYGADLRLEWVSRLREERRFDSLGALKAQLEEDRRQTNLRVLRKD